MYGVIVAIIGSFSYLFVATVAGFLLLRLFHGMSTGFSPTGQTALLSDVVPAGKRGEALGIFGVSASLGMAGGPAIGAEIARNFGLETMFFASGILSIITFFIFFPMNETLKHPRKLKLNMFRISFKDVFEPLVKGPAIVMVLYTFSFGAILTLIPDFSRLLGIENKGLYFTVYFLASLFSRIIAGKISDKFGRVVVIKSGLTIVLLGLVLTGNADSKLMFLSGAALYGFGSGVASPTVFAWTVDLSHHKYRGRGISTMFLSLEIGIGLGALTSGWLFGNEAANLPKVFWICAALVLIGILYLQLFWKNKKVVPIVLE
jgi:MFS family permease